MSNKLKTLSASQLEKLISEKISEYVEENCSCSVSNLDTPNIDSEADPAIENQQDLRFEVVLSYRD